MPFRRNRACEKRFRRSRSRSHVSIQGRRRRSAAARYRGPGAAAFWKLLTRHNPVGASHNEAGWAALMQAIAVLTPKGRDPKKQSAHDYSLPMGRALCAAGVSELRLARLLSAAPELRREARGSDLPPPCGRRIQPVQSRDSG